MTTVRGLTDFLDRLFPPALAENWDNVGLLVGDPEAEVARVMTCLTVTAQTVAEAIQQRAQLIVTHHPLPLRPLARLTTATPEGRYLLQLIAARIAIYSPHTAFDSAADGINQRLATGLGLQQITPLVPHAVAPPDTGGGRCGTVVAGTTLAGLAERAKKFLRLSRVQVVGKPDRQLTRLAVACGSAGEFLPAAGDAGCDCLLTGEMRFHACLEAEATDVALVLVGHYASERFAVEHLAEVLAAEFADLSVWASRAEHDPIQWL